MFPKGVCQSWHTWVGWLVIWYRIFHLRFASLSTTPIIVDHKHHSVIGIIIVPPGWLFWWCLWNPWAFLTSQGEEHAPHIQEHHCWLVISLDCKLPIFSFRVLVKMYGSQLMCSRAWMATLCWVDRQLPNCFLQENRKERHHIVWTYFVGGKMENKAGRDL